MRQQFDAQVEALAIALIAAFDRHGIELKDASWLLRHVDEHAAHYHVYRELYPQIDAPQPKESQTSERTRR